MLLSRRVGRDKREGFPGGGAAGGDEDLVGGEPELRIGEVGRELAQWGREIGGRGGGWLGRYRQCGGAVGVGPSLRMAQ